MSVSIYCPIDEKKQVFVFNKKLGKWQCNYCGYIMQDDVSEVLKRIETEVQDLKRILGNIEYTLKEIHASSPSERRKAMY